MSNELEAGLISAILGVVLGVLGAYVFDLRLANRARRERDEQSMRERLEHRATVATALLEDLRVFENFFRQAFDSEKPSLVVATRPALYFDALRAEMRFFGPTAIAPLAETFHLAMQYYDVLDKMREFGNGQIRSTPEREHEMRVKAGFVLQTLPAARDALLAEGAVLIDPDPKLEGVRYPELPSVPEPVFAKTRARLEKRKVDRSWEA